MAFLISFSITIFFRAYPSDEGGFPPFVLLGLRLDSSSLTLISSFMVFHDGNYYIR